MNGTTLPAIFMGVLAAFVGFASAFAVVLAGLKGVGATDAQAASGLMAVCIVQGIATLALASWFRMPISTAWSTPGAALLASAGAIEGGFPAAVGAFIVCAGLLVLSGLSRPFGRAIAAIPASLANAMLAGILLTLCLAPFQAIAFDLRLGLPILLAWVIGLRFHRLLGVPAAVGAFILVIIFGVDFPEGWQQTLQAAALPQPELVAPVFTLQAVLGIALPLFVVTMASQNLPGFAVLRANGYELPAGPPLVVTGGLSVIAAPFCGHCINLAAITAAMMVGEEAGPDPKRRWIGAVANGLVYIVVGLFAGLMATFVSLAPTILIAAVAGLALVGAMAASLVAAFKEEADRPAAAVTFLAAASGMSIAGVSGAFWGLLAGGAMLWIARKAA